MRVCVCVCVYVCTDACYGLRSVYTWLNFKGVTTPSSNENNTKHGFMVFPISIFMDVMGVNDSLMMADLPAGWVMYNLSQV